MPFSHFVQLRFSDADAMGHVNNARPLTFLEDARIRFLAQLGGGLMENGMIVARTEVDYLRPIQVVAEPLEVRLHVAEVGRSSFRLAHALVQGGEEVARAVVVLVAYDYAAGRSRPLAEPERAALEAAWAAG